MTSHGPKLQCSPQAVYTVSPKTRTSAVTHSYVQLQSQGQEAQRKEANFIKRLAGRPWRNASVFDTLTPSWKRYADDRNMNDEEI